jgi:hypothetical protein
VSEQTTYTHDVFISYSHVDSTWVRGQLLPSIEAAGLQVMIDYRDFEIGVPSLVNMERAVDNSRHTLVVLTPAWVASEWTEFESLLVGTSDPAARRRKIIPLLLEACRLPSRLAILTYADFTRPSEFEAQMARLVKSLLPQPKATPAPTPIVPPTRPVESGDSRSALGTGLVDSGPPSTPSSDVLPAGSWIVTTLEDRDAALEKRPEPVQPESIEFSAADREELADLLRRSGRARDESARRALCISIGLDPEDLDILTNTSTQNFAVQLLFHLDRTGNCAALVRLCDIIASPLKGAYADKLAIIRAKVR